MIKTKLSGPSVYQVSYTQKQSLNKNQNLITQEQYIRLMNLLQQNQSSTYSVQLSTVTSKDVQMPSFTGMSSCLSTYSNKLKIVKETPWIIDTGASYRIICDASLYSSLDAQIYHSVSLPNGEKTVVMHTGIVKLTHIDAL